MINKIRNLKKKKITLKIALFCVIFGIFLVFNCAEAGDYGAIALGSVGKAVQLILGLIAYVITAVLGGLITLLVKILVNVAGFSDIINIETVKYGWTIVRDLCNMFFVLILLVIAFAAILKVESYSVKKMLPKLLIMAILINFSRTIFGLIIDFAQVIMLTFVNAFGNGGWFIEMFQVNKWYSLSSPDMELDEILKTKGASTWTTSLAIIAGVFAAIVTLIVLAVILAVLVMRVVMLWIYTILSPLVFLGFAFPPLQKYVGKIWEDFIKQVMVGPILAFFIWLALLTAGQDAFNVNMVSLAGDSQVCGFTTSFFCDKNLQKYLITIGLLVGGLMVTQQIGGAAGSIAGKGMGAVKGLGSFVGKQPKTLANFLGRKADQMQAGVQERVARTFGIKDYQAKSLNYRMIHEGWKRQREESMKEYESGKAGTWQDKFSRVLHDSSFMPIALTGNQKRAKKTLYGEKGKGGIVDKAKNIKTYLNNQNVGKLEEDKKAAEASGDTEKATAIGQELSKIEKSQGELEVLNARIKKLKKSARRMGGRPPKDKQARLEKQRRINEYNSDINKEALTEENLVDAYQDETNRDKKRAYLQHITAVNGLNTLFDESGIEATFENVNKFLQDEFGDDAADVAVDISKLASGSGNMKWVGFGKYDSATGKNILTDKKEQLGMAHNKSLEKHAQKCVRELHWDILVDHNALSSKEVKNYRDRGQASNDKLSDLGTTALLEIANNPAKMSELKKGNFQDRFGQKVIDMSAQIEDKIKELGVTTADGKALKDVLGGFIKQYGKSVGPSDDDSTIITSGRDESEFGSKLDDIRKEEKEE